MTLPTFADFAEVAGQEPYVVRVEHRPTMAGFRLHLANGWVVSVQVGPGNYGTNQDDPDLRARWIGFVCDDDPTMRDRFVADCFARAMTAEVAVMTPRDETMMSFVDAEGSSYESDSVAGHVSRDDVLALARSVAALTEPTTIPFPPETRVGAPVP